MKTEKFPVLISEGGVSAKIRRVTQNKNGKKYTIYVVDYVLLGKRKQEGRASFEDAKELAIAACRKIANGEQDALALNQTDRLSYLRAVESLASIRIPLDTACREYAEATQILNSKASIAEACRDWMKRNAVTLPKIDVADAVQKLQAQAVTDGKSKDRQKQLAAALDRLAESFNTPVHTVTPGLISTYLAALPFKERTKRNHRDAIRFFNRWLILRGYLSKGTDWLDGVQNYSARKSGEISIYTPDEMTQLLNCAEKRFVPFLAIAAFSGIRHAEIARLDWSEIELNKGAGDSFIEVCEDKAKTQTRRLVPVRSNLKAWLAPHKKTAGRVCPVKNITKQLLRLADQAGFKWKRNALRHSYVSYRIAECADVPRVSDESGNSVQVIRTNYLRRVKPAAASEWFKIAPR